MDQAFVYAIGSLVVSQAATAIALLRISRALRQRGTEEMLQHATVALMTLAERIDNARVSLGGSIASNATAVKTSLDRVSGKLETLAAQHRMSGAPYRKQ